MRFYLIFVGNWNNYRDRLSISCVNFFLEIFYCGEFLELIFVGKCFIIIYGNIVVVF